MAIKDIIARGIGFNPGSVRFIVTHGFAAAAAVPAPASRTHGVGAARRIRGVGGVRIHDVIARNRTRKVK